MFYQHLLLLRQSEFRAFHFRDTRSATLHTVTTHPGGRQSASAPTSRARHAIALPTDLLFVVTPLHIQRLLYEISRFILWIRPAWFLVPGLLGLLSDTFRGRWGGRWDTSLLHYTYLIPRTDRLHGDKTYFCIFYNGVGTTDYGYDGSLTSPVRVRATECYRLRSMRKYPTIPLWLSFGLTEALQIGYVTFTRTDEASGRAIARLFPLFASCQLDVLPAWPSEDRCRSLIPDPVMQRFRRHFDSLCFAILHTPAKPPHADYTNS